VLQVSQVAGQAAEIPGKAQRFFVSLFATQLQYLEICAFGLVPAVGILNLKSESTQGNVGWDEGVPDGDIDGSRVGGSVGLLEIDGMAEGAHTLQAKGHSS